MEEILIVIFQFLFETVLEGLLYLPFDWLEKKSDPSEESKPVSNETLVVIGAAVLGGVLGGISLIVMPHTWIRSDVLRICNMLLAPLISAGSAWMIASHRRASRRTSPRTHALFGFTFTLLFVLVRFAWAYR